MSAIKKNLIKIAVVLATAGAFLVFDANAQVRVIKTAGANPTLSYRGVSGNSALSDAIGSDLRNCGWFDVRDSGPADYTIAGAAAGSTVTLQMAGKQRFSVTERMESAQQVRQTAHRAVDGVLKKLFGIPGICQSKIVFCLELKPGHKQIYSCDFDGANVTRITKNNFHCVEPDWFPGGDKAIVYTMYDKEFVDIVQKDLVMDRYRRLAQLPGLNAGAAIAPNGKIMALILSYGQQVDLYVKDIESSQNRKITSDYAVEASPCWSPDGRQLCFVSDKSGRPDLYTVPFAGGYPQKLSTIGSEAVSPDWSRDGTKIAYSARMGTSYSLAVCDLSGSGKGSSENIISLAGNWESPSWAPDSRHVVCSRRVGSGQALYIVDTYSGKARVLLSGNNSLSLPSWSDLIE